MCQMDYPKFIVIQTRRKNPYYHVTNMTVTLQTVWTQICTNRMWVPIWIQTIWHSDSVPERIFWKS